MSLHECKISVLTFTSGGGSPDQHLFELMAEILVLDRIQFLY